MKIDSEGIQLFHEDRQTKRQTDIYHEANSRFLKFCEQT